MFRLFSFYSCHWLPASSFLWRRASATVVVGAAEEEVGAETAAFGIVDGGIGFVAFLAVGAGFAGVVG